jgi:hypothetical protein
MKRNLIFNKIIIGLLSVSVVILFLIIRDVMFFFSFSKDIDFSLVYLTLPLKIKVINRSMFSKIFKKTADKAGKNLPSTGSISTSLSNPVGKPSQGEKGCATFSANEPDANPPNPVLANHNNPSVNQGGNTFQHIEVHRETCGGNPDCKKVICGSDQPCDNQGSREVVGNFTTKYPNNAPGTVINIDTTTNIFGDSNTPQNFVSYTTPHETNVTPEAYPIKGQTTGKGTDYLHDPQNPQRLAAIIEETKNK